MSLLHVEQFEVVGAMLTTDTPVRALPQVAHEPSRVIALNVGIDGIGTTVLPSGWVRLWALRE